MRLRRAPPFLEPVLILHQMARANSDVQPSGATRNPEACTITPFITRFLAPFPDPCASPFAFGIYAPSSVALDCTDRYVDHTVLS